MLGQAPRQPDPTSRVRSFSPQSRLEPLRAWKPALRGELLVGRRVLGVAGRRDDGAPGLEKTLKKSAPIVRDSFWREVKTRHAMKTHPSAAQTPTGFVPESPGLWRRTRCELAFIILLLIAGRAPASVSTVARFSLGDQDFNAPGRDFVVRTTQDTAGTNSLQAAGAPRYSYDVAEGASISSGSRLCVAFNGTGQALTGAIQTAQTAASRDFGLEAWVRPNTATGNRIIAYHGDTSRSGWGLLQQGDAFRVLFGGRTIWGWQTLAIGRWTHLALVRAGTVTYFLVNGIVVHEHTESPIDLTTPSFALGAPPQAIATENFDGLIDDVRVFTFAPGSFAPGDLLYYQRHPTVETLPVASFNSTSAVLRGSLLPNGQTTTAWFQWGAGFNFDRVTAPTLLNPALGAYQLSNTISGLIPGVNYHYRLVATNSAGPGLGGNLGVTTLPTNGFGTALSLNGLGQHAEMPPDVYFAGDFTIEAWVWVRSYERPMPLLEFGNGSGNDSVLLDLTSDALGHPILYTYEGSEGRTVTSQYLLPRQRWVHVAVTLNGTVGRLYLDGFVVGEYNGMKVPRSVVRNQNYLGQSSFLGHQNANAMIDEVRIWNIGRSRDEIASTMNRPLSGSEPGLMVYYRCDDDPASSSLNDLADAGGNTPAIFYDNPAIVPGLALPPALSLKTPFTANPSILELSALIDPLGSETAAWFEWGTSTAYGNIVPALALGTGVGERPFVTSLTGLSPDTLYHYRLVATNRAGRTISRDQTVATGVVVKNTADDGAGSLRQALGVVAAYGSISFAPTLNDQVIRNLSGELIVDRPMQIDGLGAKKLTIHGNHVYRVFHITSTDVSIRGLSIAGGRTAGSSLASVAERSGGGILSTAGLNLRDCYLTDNIASLQGGAIALFSPEESGGGVIVGCTFAGNRVEKIGYGNAISIGQPQGPTPEQTSVQLFNCTLANNGIFPTSSDFNIRGGAIASAADQLTLESCTITENIAGAGAGIFVGAGTTRLYNTIIAANHTGGGTFDTEVNSDGNASLISLGYSLVGRDSPTHPIVAGEGDQIGTREAPISPGLAPLADNGGDTPTCALLAGSPAINAGGDSELPRDQRGLPRYFGPRADIGAYELQLVNTIPPIRLLPPQRLANGSMQLTFTNLTGLNFIVLASTNVAAPLQQWNLLGRAVEDLPGRYLFSDPALNRPAQRFYRVKEELP